MLTAFSAFGLVEDETSVKLQGDCVCVCVNSG